MALLEVLFQGDAVPPFSLYLILTLADAFIQSDLQMRTIEAIKNAPVSPAKEAIYILYFSVKLLVLSHYFIIVQCCFVDVHILLTAVFFVFFLLFVKLYVCIPQSPERCRVVQQKQKPVT